MPFQEGEAVSHEARKRTGRSAARKAPDVVLASDVTVADAFRIILRHCLDHLLANQAATLAGETEGVHQMRVALRRLLAALSLFRGVLVESWMSAAIRADLRWLQHELGITRDWDVLATETLVRTDSAIEPEVASAVARSTAEARGNLIEGLRSDRYRRLLAALEEWLAEDRWCRRPGLDVERPAWLDGPLIERAGVMLDRPWRQARRAGKSLEALSDEARHDVRKSLKKLRYGIEFFAALYPSDLVGRQVAMTRALQDVLGAANDRAVAKELLARVGGSGALAEPGIATAGQLWRKFRKTPPFWAPAAMEPELAETA